MLRPEEQGFSSCAKATHAWRVNGRTAERAVALADLTNPEAMAYVQQRLRRMGVERALAARVSTTATSCGSATIELTYEEGM